MTTIESKEIITIENEMFHIVTSFFCWYYKNTKDNSYVKLIKFIESNNNEITKIIETQENLFIEEIDRLIQLDKKTIIVLPPIKKNRTRTQIAKKPKLPLPRIFKKICRKYQDRILIIKSNDYLLKNLNREERFIEIENISKNWTYEKPKIGIKNDSNFLYVDDIYTTGATFLGTIKFLERKFKENWHSFRRVEKSLNDTYEHINFDRFIGLFFARTFSDHAKKNEHIKASDHKICKIIDEKWKLKEKGNENYPFL